MKKPKTLEERFTDIELGYYELLRKLSPNWKTTKNMINEKITDLGLIIIDQNKRIDKLEKEIKKLKEQVEK